MFAKFIKKIFDNIFYGYLITVACIFFIVIPTSDFSTALVGSLFFGVLALPITALVLLVIALLLPYDIDQNLRDPSLISR